MNHLAHMYSDNYAGHMWEGGGWYTWLWLGFWGLLLAVLAVGLLRWLTNQRPTSKSALDIAKERLAKGEISQKEFQGLKKELK